mmetsp:Transcript_76700/g.248302  ORF Transcript_76700/g.248302 Transcript_76700/m.248302 type:complete len:108 (-) Transcript_76700:1042-1365(-)
MVLPGVTALAALPREASAPAAAAASQKARGDISDGILLKSSGDAEGAADTEEARAPRPPPTEGAAWQTPLGTQQELPGRAADTTLHLVSGETIEGAAELPTPAPAAS